MKPGRILAVAGVVWCLVVLALMAAVFGITFGTGFLLSIGILLIIWGFLLEVNRTHKRKYGNLPRVLLGVFYFILVLGTVSFVTVQAMVLTHSGVPPEEVQAQVDHIIIMGAAFENKEPGLALSSRLDTGAEYLRKNPEVVAVVSGGKPPGEDVSEAKIMKDYLLEQGVEKDRILKENRASNTHENIIYSQKILKEENISAGAEEFKLTGKVGLVTNDYHLFRSKLLARRHGVDATQGIAAETPTLILMNYLVREYLAVLKSWVFDHDHNKSEG